MWAEASTRALPRHLHRQPIALAGGAVQGHPGLKHSLAHAAAEVVDARGVPQGRKGQGCVDTSERRRTHTVRAVKGRETTCILWLLRFADFR